MHFSGFDIFTSIEMFDFYIHQESPILAELIPGDIDYYISKYYTDERVVKEIDTTKVTKQVQKLRESLKNIGFKNKKKLKESYIKFLKDYIRTHRVVQKEEENFGNFKISKKTKINNDEPDIDNYNVFDQNEENNSEDEIIFELTDSNKVEDDGEFSLKKYRRNYSLLNTSSLPLLERHALEFVMDNMRNEQKCLKEFTLNGKKILANKAFLRLRMKRYYDSIK